MNKSEYITMAQRERNYWWHLGRLRLIETYLDKYAGRRNKNRLLNVGCGTGGTIDTLQQFGMVDNVDISEDAIRFMKQNGYKRLKKVDGVKLPYPNDTFDVVGAFDVLEHIANDKKALIEWRRVLRDRGLIILTVPAYQWLWTEHDVSLHHKRRYTKKRLKEAAKAAGFVPVKVTYAISFSLPLVVGFRALHKLSNKKTNAETSYVNVPDSVNKLFTKLLYTEAKLHKYTKMPFGTSVVGILKKEKDAAEA